MQTSEPDLIYLDDLAKSSVMEFSRYDGIAKRHFNDKFKHVPTFYV